MTTTVVKTIGTGGDYSTIGAWNSACPADLVANDQIWQGQLKNQIHSLTGAALVIFLGSGKTDATRYIELTTEAGASFRDNANVQTNALFANSSNGAIVTSTSGYANIIGVQQEYTRVNKAQVTATGNASVPIVATKRCWIDWCILEASSGAAQSSNPTVGNCQVTNTLHIQRGSAKDAIAVTSGNYEGENNTYACPSDKTAATYALRGNYATATIKNCAMFGATNALKNNNSTFTTTTCYTDQASPPSGFTQVAYDTSTGSGFQNITDATRDYRLKSTSALIDVGTTDATNAPVDIAGTARPSGSAYDVGCWEFVQASGQPTMRRFGGVRFARGIERPSVRIH